MQDKKRSENFTKAKQELINMCSSLQSNPASVELIQYAEEAKWYDASADDERLSTLQVLLHMQEELDNLLQLLIIENEKDVPTADALEKWERKMDFKLSNYKKFRSEPDVQEWSPAGSAIEDVLRASLMTNILITLCNANQFNPDTKEFRILKNSHHELKEDVEFTADHLKSSAWSISGAIEGCKTGSSFSELNQLALQNKDESINLNFLKNIKNGVIDIEDRMKLYSEMLIICNNEIVDRVTGAMKKVSMRYKQLNENDGPFLP